MNFILRNSRFRLISAFLALLIYSDPVFAFSPSLLTPNTYDSANRLLTSKNKTYAYDLNGNLTQEKIISSNITRTYTYDFENRLKQVTQGANKAIYRYDGLGRRTGKSVNGQATRFYHDGFDVFRCQSLNLDILPVS